MQYEVYKSVETLPLINWHKLQTSHKEGLTDLRYLLKIDVDSELPTDVDYKLLNEVYEQITNQLPDMDLSFIKFSTLYELQYRKYNLLLEKHKFNEMIGRPSEYPADIDLNKSFTDYFNELHKVFDSSKIKQYSFKKNYKEVCEKIYNADPKLFEFLEGAIFYHVNQLLKLVEDSDKNMINIILHPVFFDNFIETKEVEINNLRDFDNYLSSLYKKINKYHEFHKVRFDLFSLEQITGEKSETNTENSTLFHEIVFLNKLTGYKLDMRSSTLAELFAVRDLAKKIINDNKKHTK